MAVRKRLVSEESLKSGELRLPYPYSDREIIQQSGQAPR